MLVILQGDKASAHARLIALGIVGADLHRGEGRASLGRAEPERATQLADRPVDRASTSADVRAIEPLVDQGIACAAW